MVLSVPQLSSRVDREFSEYKPSDLVQAVPGVKITNVFLSEDILMIGKNAPEFLKKAYPAYVSAKLRVADVQLDSSVEVVATMGKKPYLVKANYGKGAFWLSLAWDYPAARREREEFPSFRPLRLEFWKTLVAGIVDAAQEFRIEGADKDYICWSVYKEKFYFLNMDCVSSRKFTFMGKEYILEPKGILELKR